MEAEEASALDMMWALVLEDGRLWGEAAADFQKEDATAVFAPERPNLHYLTRPRGGSKTTDIAAVCVAWLSIEAPSRARGYVVASNATQAAELIDAAASLIDRTPELQDFLVVENERIIAPNGAWVRVLTQSDSGAWGKRDAHFLVCDEFAQWPETRGAKRVWTAIRTTVQKTPGCRLIILTSSGEPSHWSHEVLEKALRDPANWRVHQVPGPVPWHSVADLEALQRELLPSEYERLVLNIWSESEDRAITPEDYEAAAAEGQHSGTAPAGVKGSGRRLRGPRSGTRYIVTVDVGTRNDATVMAVVHKEPLDPDNRRAGYRVVVDHLERWQGSKRHHVQVDAIRDRVRDLALEYNRAKVYADPDQFVGSLQHLNRSGIHAEEWTFSATSVGQAATALVQTFRNRLIEVPHTPELQEELLRVRLRESAPGVTRLDHESGAHDDQAVALAVACHVLLGNIGMGFGSARDFIDASKRAGEILEERRAKRWGENRRREGQVPRRHCEHRTRGNRCVFCGERVEEVAAG